MQRRKFVTVTALVLSAFIFSQALQAQLPTPTVQASASANYQSVSSNPNTVTITNIPGPPNGSFPNPAAQAVLQAIVPNGGAVYFDPNGRAVAFNDAEGMARASLPGTMGARARAAGFASLGGPPNIIDGFAEARQITNWIANSASPGQVMIDLAAFYDGYLYISTNSQTTPNLSAEVEMEMNVITASGSTQVFAASGVLDFSGGNLHTTFNALNGAAATEFNDAWDGGQMFGGNGFDLLYDLDYFEFFEDMFMVDANVPFAFESVIRTRAINGVGPNELFATSDFFNTASLDLTSNTAGVTLQQISTAVPEPSTISLILVGCAGMLIRRRNR